MVASTKRVDKLCRLVFYWIESCRNVRKKNFSFHFIQYLLHHQIRNSSVGLTQINSRMPENYARQYFHISNLN